MQQFTSPPTEAHKTIAAARGLLSDTPFHALSPLLERWWLDDVKRACKGLPECGEEFFAGLLKNLNIGYECAREDLDRIPATAPALVVANHPFGLIEGVVLGTILSKIRPDVRLLANSSLASVPALHDWIIPVNPFGGQRAVRDNLKPLRRCIDWLKAGGLLVVFPAGEVATIQFPPLAIADGEWTTNVARLSRLTGAGLLPVFFHGTNSPAFHAAGLVHPRLRTVLLSHEFFNKAGRRIRLSIGTLIPADRLEAASDGTAYVRGRTLLLEAREQRTAQNGRFPGVRQAAIANPQDPNTIAAEIKNLPSDHVLLRNGEHLVCFADAGQIPCGLMEIGRLREITFRQVGEGTGRASDLDEFDRYYKHLLVWNEEAREIVGAYRFAKTDEVIATCGVRGLYTSTLFRLTPDFYRSVQPALELGRSFVRSEYRRSFLPLLLLWQGIGHYVARSHRHRILFGPVSISRDYTSSSRALIVSFLKSKCCNDQLAVHVKPRKPFKTHRLGACDPRNFSSLLSDIDELSDVVSDIEPDHKRLPILLRHYVNLGGQVLDFSVDRKFSNVLDGLVVLDLAKVSKRRLERYMGPEHARDFLRKHAMS